MNYTGILVCGIIAVIGFIAILAWSMIDELNSVEKNIMDELQSLEEFIKRKEPS